MAAPVEWTSYSATDDAEYVAEYWHLDAEAREVFAALAPEAAGESVPLSELAELCLRMRRPLRNDGEQHRLMTELDTTNQMLVLRHDFVTWLLRDLLMERALANARLYQPVATQIPVAQPAWEEIVELIPSQGVGMPVESSTFYYNALTGESQWELPGFIQCLRAYLVAQDAKRALRFALPADGAPLFVDALPEEDEDLHHPSELQQLRELFTKCDDDASGTLDATEFEDLCVSVGQPLNGREGVAALMNEVDPYSGFPVVSWDALKYYWVSYSPFQRRSKLDPEGSPLAAWEQIDAVQDRDNPALFRQTATLTERWNHPMMENQVAELLTKLFPSSKLDATKKIELFLDVQWQLQQQQQQQYEQATTGPVATSSSPSDRQWNFHTCWRVLAQLNHPMKRRKHLEAAIGHIQTRFSSSEAPSSSNRSLDEIVARQWLEYSVQKAERNGWEEIVDSETGQPYFYHELSGATQWDPPNLGSQLADMLGKGVSDVGGKKLTPSERVARIFRQYDTDESGAITLDEFRPFYRALVGRGSSSGFNGNKQEVSEAQIQHVFSVLDTSGDGEVSLDEFLLWWRTKLQLEEEETEEDKLYKKRAQQRALCCSFLENVSAAMVHGTPNTKSEDGDGGGEGSISSRKPQVGFESSYLPRLVGLLGPFMLKGLTYRSALTELVADFTQMIDLDAFLDWYQGFEQAETERQEMEAAKAKARAEVIAQQQKELSKAKEKRRKMKQKRQLTTPAVSAALSDAAAREKKIEALFKAFDTNGSGFLDEKELQQLVKALGHDMSDEQVHQMFQVMDASGDQQVNLSEFLAFWNAFQPTTGGAKDAKAPAAAVATTTTTATDKNEPAAVQHPATFTEVNASLEVALELAKERALKLTLSDFTDYFGEKKADYMDRKKRKLDEIARKQREAAIAAEHEELRRQRYAFKPDRIRKYGERRLDVTWIEPEVVECVIDVIRTIAALQDPPFRPDAAQRIQALGKGYVTRNRVYDMIQQRFAKHIDPHTRLFYYIDTATAHLHLELPIWRSHMSSVSPFDLDDCNSKIDRYQFQKKMVEMERKSRFYERNFRRNHLEANKSSDVPSYRPMFAPAALYLFDTSELVKQRLLGNIWSALRNRELILVEMIASRHPRQLRQRSSDAAFNLPLHYVIRESEQFPIRVARSMVRGFPDALIEVDAYGMAPLHLALRERRTTLELLELLSRWPGRKQATAALWKLQTVCGDTILHVAVRYRASIAAMQWMLSHQVLTIDTVTAKNKRGESAFHTSIKQFEPRFAYAKTVVLLFLKRFDPVRLCSNATRRGDLPLHLALDAFEQHQLQLQQSPKQITGNTISDGIDEGWIWLTRELTRHFTMTLTVKKPSSNLLPLHLAIKFGLPQTALRPMLQQTLAACAARSTGVSLEPSACATETTATKYPQEFALRETTIEVTQTTLVHYVIMHQPHATDFILELLELMPGACAAKTAPSGDLPLHLAASVHVNRNSDMAANHLRLIERLCEINSAACETYNAAQQLPIHLAITRGNSADAIKLLLGHSSSVLRRNQAERNGLRALVMAANNRFPDYQILLALLDVTPARDIVPADASKSLPVTPLYALSMRKCSPAVASHRIPQSLHSKYEQIDHESAYFTEMAKAKFRHRHHCPTAKWEFKQILTLMERNPVDEAVMQRALFAINAKLQSIFQSQDQMIKVDGNQSIDPKTNAVVDSITMDADLMLVRSVHLTMYDFPLNARIQIIGQNILDKLLPTAFAKAAYRSKIDPYFNL